MFYLKKILEISSSHKLSLNYDSKCLNLHGHNWMVTIYCKSEKLNDNGMIIDFVDIKKIVEQKLDHQNLNELFDFNPTAENIAQWVVNAVPFCYKCVIEESKGNEVTYVRD